MKGSPRVAECVLGSVRLILLSDRLVPSSRKSTCEGITLEIFDQKHGRGLAPKERTRNGRMRR